MKNLSGFKKLGLIALSGLIASACGPVAPSVSKLSNAAAEKTDSIDGASPNSPIFSTGGVGSARATTDGNPQTTSIETYADYKRDWSLIRDSKPFMDLDRDSIEELFASNSTGASFLSSSENVRGQEAAFGKTKTRIRIAVNADRATISSLHLDELKLALLWRPLSHGNPVAHWELKIVAPNSGDPVKYLNDLNQLKASMRGLALEIGIEFQTE